MLRRPARLRHRPHGRGGVRRGRARRRWGADRLGGRRHPEHGEEAGDRDNDQRGDHHDGDDSGAGRARRGRPVQARLNRAARDRAPATGLAAVVLAGAGTGDATLAGGALAGAGIVDASCCWRPRARSHSALTAGTFGAGTLAASW
ncbi:hypothetical protein [Catenuloplanes niger]